MPYSSLVRRKPRDTAREPTPVATELDHSVGDDHPPTRAREERRELMKQIAAFIERHDLAPTGGNLAAICGALSGSNTKLAEAFAAREIAKEPIDQRWLETITRLDPGTNDRMTELEKLMDRLEYSMMRFAQTAKSAQDETSDGREAIGAQINAMTEASDAARASARSTGDAPVELSQMIELSRAMMARIEQVENAMERSQAETDRLRENLAKARTEADVDHLTRLPNRRAFERRFAAAANDAQAKGEPLCVAFCDVDHFKKINDTHGHEAGDRILVAIATTLNEIASDQCFVSRHGGEEFVLLLYGHDKDSAWRKLEGVRRIMANRQLMNRETGKPFGKVTFSGGIADVTEDADARSALSRADEALYQAKAAGRNQIIAL
ncbi:MAG: GGDEF domain-containing protein [Pseudomonadota bacterium]